MKSPCLVPLGLPVLAIVAWRAANEAGTADAPDSCTDPGTEAWELVSRWLHCFLSAAKGCQSSSVLVGSCQQKYSKDHGLTNSFDSAYIHNIKCVHPHIPPPHSVTYGVLVVIVIQLGAIRFSVTKKRSCASSEGAQSFNASIMA